MFQSLLLFLAPAAPAAQAVLTSPPAVTGAAERPGGRAATLRFVLRVIGDAVGFALLFAVCWLYIGLLAAIVGSTV